MLLQILCVPAYGQNHMFQSNLAGAFADSRSPLGPPLVTSLLQAAMAGTAVVRTEGFLSLQVVAADYHVLIAGHWKTLRAAVQAALSAECDTGVR